jgi:hypothetical protein
LNYIGHSKGIEQATGDLFLSEVHQLALFIFRDRGHHITGLENKDESNEQFGNHDSGKNRSVFVIWNGFHAVRPNVAAACAIDSCRPHS